MTTTDSAPWVAVATSPQRGVLADIHPTAVLGEGTVVWSFAVVCAGVRTGTQCAIGSTVYVGRDTVLGDSVRIQGGCHLTDRMTVGHRVFFGPNVTTMNDRHPKVNNQRYRCEPPIIEDDVSIGAGAVILPGVRLGEGCVVGAGAVVTHGVAPYTTVIGNPARPIVRREEE